MKAMVDGQGRVLGRINLFDAAVLAFVVLLVPMAYAAFLLFRTPSPRITSVEPAPITFIEDRAAGGSALRGKLKVRGSGLRPVLRATIDNEPAIAYIFENPTSADVLYGNVPPGTHDLVLYDGVQQVARAAKAVTIAAPPPPPSVRVKAVGRLIDLDEGAARALAVGAKYPAAGEPLAEITALGEPAADAQEIRTSRGSIEVAVVGRWQRPAAVVLPCELAPPQCRVGGNPLTEGTVVDVPGSAPALRLRVEEVVPGAPPTPATVRVRFLAPAEAIDLIKVGDVDASAPAVDGRGATVVQVERRDIVAGSTTLSASPDGFVPAASIGAADRVAAIDATLRLGADADGGGYRYRLQPLVVGRSILFVTPRYTVRGLVRSLTASTDAPSAQRR